MAIVCSFVDCTDGICLKLYGFMQAWGNRNQ